MVTPLFALGFFGYGVGKNFVTYVSPPPTISRNLGDDGIGIEKMTLSPVKLFCAGAISSCFTNPVVAPVERIKCLLQVFFKKNINDNFQLKWDHK